jgi:hypothetical protein
MRLLAMAAEPERTADAVRNILIETGWKKKIPK